MSANKFDWIHSFGVYGNRSVIASTTVLAGLVLWLVGLMSKASLITATARLNQNQRTTLRESVDGSVDFLKPMVGVSLLLFGPYFIVSLLVSQVPITPRLSILPFAFLECLLPLARVLIAAILPLAQRGIVLRESSIISSIFHSWQFLREHIGELVSIALYLVLRMLFFALVLGIVLLPFAALVLLPAFLAWFETGSLSTAQLLSVMVFGLVITALGSVVQTYLSVTLTLAYLKLTECRRSRKR
jgi:hypothetical protein